MIYCTNCGHGNTDASNFCSQCGTALPKQAAAPAEPVRAAEAPGEPTTRPAEADQEPAPSGPESGAEPPSEPAPSGSGSFTTGSSAAGRTGDTTRTMPAMGEDDDSGLSPDDVEAVNALPRGSALLIVRRGADAGSRFLLDTESSTVGRSQDADILLDDISVSRRHAVFTRTDAGVVVKDVGSLNGTYVNRQMVDEQLLQPGDEVQIGKFRLVFYAARG
ncbi:FHA domain-containing protein [Microlunatus soli]|uniref:Zinc-ribbon domain-containing protein n=1 Tax=Microlunatus soli TaxID=630515 RepID=A0A1H2ANP1_9ACTN|nr:FHA domain-containing protein [Microlunatus soli]SDT47176.1 zinc-ribbon domain-containing protein [Microlunatus soli]